MRVDSKVPTNDKEKYLKIQLSSFYSMLQGHPEKKQRRRISDSLQVTKASHIVRIPWLIRNAGVELTTLFWLRMLIFSGGIPCCCWLHFKLPPTQFNFFLLLFSSTVEAILITLALPKLLLLLRLMTCAPTDVCWHHFLKVCPLFDRNLRCIRALQGVCVWLAFWQYCCRVENGAIHGTNPVLLKVSFEFLSLR